MEQPEAPIAPESVLYVANKYSKLHVRACPHVLGVELTPATASDVAERAVCTWCKAELDGFGRTLHETIEAALDDLGAPQHARAELARLLRVVEHDQIHVPYSRSYVALTRGGKAVAWAGKTYVGYSDRPPVLLPDYSAGGGGGRAKDERWGETCPRCFTTRSVTGACACG